ncbi:MAG: HU family DNA-binding protein [Parabacteroides sp.]
MSAEYKLVRRPNMGKRDEKQPLFPRFAPIETMRTEYLINRAQMTTFSSAEVKGMLEILQDAIVKALESGNNIEIEGIGTFSLTLKERPVMDKKEIRSESITFKDVTFRSSSALRKRLQSLQLTRVDCIENAGFREEECETRTMKYLETHDYITGRDYSILCKCGSTKASIDLRKMKDAGKLTRTRLGSLYLYKKLLDKNKQ